MEVGFIMASGRRQNGEKTYDKSLRNASGVLRVECKFWLTDEKGIRREIVSTGTSGKPTSIAYGGRLMTWRKKQACALHETAVAEAQAPREGFAEIRSGRSRRQQGLVATCRDSSNEA
jgi:hypothetical protein